MKATRANAILLLIVLCGSLYCGFVVADEEAPGFSGWSEDDQDAEENVEEWPDEAPEFGDYTDDDLWESDEEKKKKMKADRPESIEIHSPWPEEIFSNEDGVLSFTVHNFSLPEMGKAVVKLNGNVATVMEANEAYVGFPKMSRGFYHVLIELVDTQGAPIGVEEETHFEVSGFPLPEDIMPDPPGSIGLHSNATEPPLDLNYKLYSPQVQKVLYEHQNPPAGQCGKRFLIWESWGIVGFGAQVLGLRVALAVGLETNRVVVGNPDHEAHLVKSELQWRFGKSGALNAPWGQGLKAISPCTDSASVHVSSRPQSWEDLFDDYENLLVSGDIWGIRNREHLFTLPQRLVELLPKSDQPPNIMWWWTEVIAYLLRPGPTLADFIAEQKAKMGWKTPVIGIHMRLGLDKNREAQRFPTLYYIHEARRLKKLFGVRTIFVCSDRKKAVDKMVNKYGPKGTDEFDFLVQPEVEEHVSPMFTMMTDLLLLAESEYLIISFSSNYGQAALLLNSYYHGHRPTYISMDNVYQGFRYYGWELRLHRDPQTGVNEIMLTDCIKDHCPEQDESMASGDHRVLGFDYVDQQTRSQRLWRQDEL